MQEQSRILLLLRYLFENTDADHAVSTRDIKTMLEQHGVQPPVSRTIDADVDLWLLQVLMSFGHTLMGSRRTIRSLTVRLIQLN